jgi:putative hydrolase of the HAD superfamily
MNIRGLIFDINGTLIDINTNEGADEIYRLLSNFLLYQGVRLEREQVRKLYFQIMKEQRQISPESHPEFDVADIFETILYDHAGHYTQTLSAEKQNLLPLILAEIFRAASLNRLQLYPGVLETLDTLRLNYELAVLTDAQSQWAIPELNSVGLLDYFNPMIISGDYGYRKPDSRLFELVLAELQLTTDEVLFIGNDMYRDVYGPAQMGIKTIYFRSNQGEQKPQDVEPDYIIYNFSELRSAVEFFEKDGFLT